MLEFILPVTLLFIKIRNEKKKKNPTQLLTSQRSHRLSFGDRYQQKPGKS